MANYLKDQKDNYGNTSLEELPEYRYQTLSFSTRKTDIRLLKLAPRSGTGLIECQLIEHSLRSDTPRFEAVSYCWGSAESTVRIMCDGRILKVSPIVAAMLSRLRLRDRYQHIWIDALCIDQSNLDEREQQVQIMQDIYRRAHRTVIWLGGEDHQDAFGVFSGKAFKLIRHPTEATQKYEKSGRRSQKYSTAASTIENVLERPWFDRVWCVQEVIVARRVSVISGPDEIEWSAFRNGLTQLQEKDPRFQSAFGAYRADSLIERKIRSFAVPDVPTANEPAASYLLRILIKYRSRLATDPRDKVYGLHGLVRQHIPEFDFTASYKESYAQVVHRVARHIINSTSRSDILSVVSGPKLQALAQLPSWAPDWSNDKVCVRPFARPPSPSCNCSLSTSLCHHFSANASNHRLMLHGAILTSVEDCGSCFRLSPTDSLEFEAFEHLWARPKAVLSSKPNDIKINDSAPGLQKTAIGTTYGLAALGAKVTTSLAGHRVHALLQQLRVLFEWETIAWKNEACPTGETRRSAFLTTICAGNLSGQAKEYYEEWQDSVGLMRRAYEKGVDKWEVHVAGAWYMSQPDEDRHKLLTASRLVRLLEYSYDRKFARTANNHYCLVPEATEKGDFVAVAHGCNYPLIMREYGEEWQVVGEAYAHGMMTDRVWQNCRTKSLSVR